MSHETQTLAADKVPLPARGTQSSSAVWRYLAYYLGVPIVVASYAALNNWEILEVAGLPVTLAFYLAHAVPPWWITCTCTTLCMRGLSRWQPPWMVLLACGHLAGSILVLPYSNWLIAQVGQGWPALGLGEDFAPLFSTDFWMYLLRAGVIWFGVNFLFDRFLGLPLYRYSIPRGFAGPAEDEPATVQRGASAGNDSELARQPAFVSRLPTQLQPADIIAIKAEQHYIKILTAERQYMVLYRLSDAIRELDPKLGVQVHRSWWASFAHIDSVHAKAKDFYLRMSNGESVPVSGPYQGMVRELTRSRSIRMAG